MAIEIERKFFVINDNWKDNFNGVGTYIKQAYFRTKGDTTVRIRLLGSERAVLGIKGLKNGFSRYEFEYDIPRNDALEMMANMKMDILTKTRYVVYNGPNAWEIDVYDGENNGLIVAEIELEYEDQMFEKPDWVGHEITGLGPYTNRALAKHPYSKHTRIMYKTPICPNCKEEYSGDGVEMCLACLYNLDTSG